MSDGTKKPIYKKWWLYLVSMIVVVGVAATAGCGNANKDDTKTASTQTNETQDKTDENKDAEIKNDSTDKNSEKEADKSASETTDASVIKVTFDDFSNLKLGDSYDNVVALIGEGEQVGSEDNLTSYRWVNNDSSVVSLTFEDNVLVGKIQNGLKAMNCNVTLEAYNEISEEEGTYDDMIAKLGEPQVMAENNLDGIEYVTYEYVNSDKSRAEFTVYDGMIVAKDQTNLQ